MEDRYTVTLAKQSDIIKGGLYPYTVVTHTSVVSELTGTGPGT